jgi:hypothetical protein
MKVLQNQSYQTYSALIAHDYIVEHEGKKYLATHSISDDGEESFECFTTDPDDFLSVSGRLYDQEIKAQLFKFVRNMFGKVEY